MRRSIPRAASLVALVALSLLALDACRRPAPSARAVVAAPVSQVPQVDIGYVPDREAVAAIMAAGRDTLRLADDLAYLTDVIGPRLTGTEGLRRAVDWSMRRLREDGADSVWSEALQLGQGWERGTFELHMTAPHRRQLVGASWGWTPGTDGPREGDLVYVDAHSIADFGERFAGRLAGKWVMIRPPGVVRQRYAPPGTAADSALFEARRKAHAAPLPAPEAELRRGLVPRLRAEGVAGIVRDAERPEGRLLMSGGPEGAYPFPYVVVPHETYAQFHRLLARGERVAISANIENRFTDPMTVHNVVAEIRGSERPDEMVILGAHLDSWDLGTGATDNAAGVAAVMGALRVLHASGVRPRRTVRVVLFTGEEQGLYGGDAYVKAHASELPGIQAVLVLDNGASRIDGMSLQGRAEYASAWQALFAPVRALGPFAVRARSKGASDHRAFIARGVPGFNYDQQEGRGYDETYHNELDSFDHAWPAEMQQAATVMAVHAHALANLPRLLPRWK
jgi:carboxypeptidase Q